VNDGKERKKFQFIETNQNSEFVLFFRIRSIFLKLCVIFENVYF
jgi:hypothetical protein